ncbi:sigma-54 interaction domain-containing protein [Shewanella polaris]|uniref:Sigma-54-dependent Fis family transcriptional regulator n=1 Tax=Shewanella polaris TaxID=2588449 RepID=A0A4Y5YK26_9GAMM|nr:sigma-54 dependent transcriptional regulator [Shewanella polaris]QDE32968.1 sigma-54-dependent Fis family transcriptional regulator [Shewanella polaris]
MPRPTLFYHLHRRQEGEARLLALPSCQHFNKIASSVDQPWLDQLHSNSIDVAIIELSQLSQQEYAELTDSALMSDIEFIFLSEGKPNPNLDHLMSKSAGYHFRQPYDADVINDTLEDFAQDLQSQSTKLKQPLSSELDQYGLLVGSSRSMHKLYRTIRKVAVTESNVLIVGESGVGKELVANTIHLASNRVNQPFIAINCGALSPELVDSELFGHVKGAFTGAHRDHRGVFEQAEGGTLFLDEVTEMPLEHQVKLLRVLENNEYRSVGSQHLKKANVRIVAATNRDPADAIDAGRFREDLYFRLAHFPIRVPPLRDRNDDITGLAQHFLAYRNTAEKLTKTFSDDALKLIQQQKWSGNVRELKHTIERAYILAEDIILPSHITVTPLEPSTEPLADDVQIPAGMRLDELEKVAIYQALDNSMGNKNDTAKQLGISVKTLYNKLSKYEDQTDSDEP